MIRILADSNAEGHLEVLLRHVCDGVWREFWDELNVGVVSFEDVGLERDATDRELWRACQREQVVLLTNNRNAKGPESLEAVLQAENRVGCLPVFTLASPERLRWDTTYARETAERLVEYLAFLDEIQGVGRIYLP